MFIDNNGNVEEMTSEELARFQSTALQSKSAELSVEDKLLILANSIEVNKPNDTNELPFKLGYKWEPIYNGTSIAWTLVKDENSIGTENNPIEYYDGVELINNAYYLKDGVRVVYMNGEFIEF